MGAEELWASSLITACASTAAAAVSSSAHHALEQGILPAFESSATTARTETTGTTAGEMSALLMTSPLTPAERHQLLYLWRRLSSKEPLLTSHQGTSEGPSLAVLLEVRWGLPVSLLSAAHTQRAFLRWLYSALHHYQQQQYLRAQQQQQQQQQQGLQEQGRQQQPHEASWLDRLEEDAFQDLLRSIRSRFDLQEAAAARTATLQAQQQPHEKVQLLLKQWKKAVRGLEEGDLLCNTYRLVSSRANRLAAKPKTCTPN